MPDEAKVNVIGFTELRAGSRSLFDEIERRASRDLLTVAEQRAAMVRAAVPHVTGRLAGSVQADPNPAGSQTSIGDESTPYAGWIEFGGTRGRPYVPQGRYLYPIALDAGQLIDREMTAATKDEIKGHRWPKPQITA